MARRSQCGLLPHRARVATDHAGGKQGIGGSRDDETRPLDERLSHRVRGTCRPATTVGRDGGSASRATCTRRSTTRAVLTFVYDGTRPEQLRELGERYLENVATAAESRSVE